MNTLNISSELADKELADYLETLKINFHPTNGSSVTFMSFIGTFAYFKKENQNVREFRRLMDPRIRHKSVNSMLKYLYAGVYTGQLPENITSVIGEEENFATTVSELEKISGMKAPVALEFMFSVDAIWIDWVSMALAKGMASKVHSSVNVRIGYDLDSVLSRLLTNTAASFIRKNCVLYIDFIQILGVSQGAARIEEGGRIYAVAGNPVTASVRHLTRVEHTAVRYSKDILTFAQQNVEFARAYKTWLKAQQYKQDIDESRMINFNGTYVVVNEGNSALGTTKGQRAKTWAEKQRERAERLSSQSNTGLCPHPDKKIHPTVDVAWDFIENNHSQDPFIQPYRCPCGAIHIGHSSKVHTRKTLTSV